MDAARRDFLRDLASSGDPDDILADVSTLDEFSEVPLDSDEDLGLKPLEDEEW
jgi:hypothetical protein